MICGQEGKKMFRFLVIAVCAAMLAAPAHALLYDSGNPPQNWTYMPLANADWGEPFSTNHLWQITSIGTNQSGAGTDDTVYFYLMQGANTIGSWSRAAWNGGWGYVSTDITINPGNYTMVFKHASNTAWAIGNPCPNGSNGWFDQRPYDPEYGIYQQTGPLALRIDGYLPEPSGWVTLGGALSGLLAAAWRRRR